MRQHWNTLLAFAVFTTLAVVVSDAADAQESSAAANRRTPASSVAVGMAGIAAGGARLACSS